MSHPSLTPAQAERLEMLAEEDAEIVQACTKILRHGYDSQHPDDPGETNKEQLEEEIMDVHAVLGMMRYAGDIETPDVVAHTAGRIQRKFRYTHHQKEIGG